jgi:hypothetical protein
VTRRYQVTDEVLLQTQRVRDLFSRANSPIRSVESISSQGLLPGSGGSNFERYEYKLIIEPRTDSDLPAFQGVLADLSQFQINGVHITLVKLKSVLSMSSLELRNSGSSRRL